MVVYSTPPEGIDDKFIQILIEELGPKGPPVPDGEDGQPRGLPARPASYSDDLLPCSLEHLDEASTDQASSRPDGPAIATGPLVLRVVEPESREQVVKLTGRPIGIGRSRINTVVVRCPRVSRKHLRVWMEEGVVWVEEMTGNHRMSVNGTKMSRARLQLNDEVQVGSVKIYLEPEENSRPT